MQFARLPRFRLAPLPTPLEEAPRLRRALGADAPRILVKRDDLTGLAFGGNKVRKLEYHLGEALAQRCDVLVTTGAIQSNHCRVTAAAARRAGLDAVLVLRPGEPEVLQGNLLLDRVLGARVRIAPAPTAQAVDATLGEELDALGRAGRRPYFIPKGASTPLGAAAYAEAFTELMAQATAAGAPIDALVVSTGSGGTQAGLIAGARMTLSDVDVVGVADGTTRDALAPFVVEIVRGLAGRCRVPLSVEADDVEILEEYGGTYGVPTADCVQAIRLAARSEGLILDPVYTGKAMAGLVDLVRRRRWGPDQTVVFWHTGGQPALFALADAVGAPE
jgi:D-cysteine desulfhydrase family pyridoxal phosphate-dependent enzyme